MTTVAKPGKTEVGTRNKSKPYSFDPSYLRNMTKTNRKPKKPTEESQWAANYQNSLDTVEEVSESSSTLPSEVSPRNPTELTKSRTYVEIKAKLQQISKNRKKATELYLAQHIRKKRFKLTGKKIIVLLRWTKFYLHSSKVTTQEAKRLYMEIHERRSDYDPVDLMFDKSSYKAKTAVRISKETRRILMKSPAERTDEEVFRAQIALGNIKDIAQYPFRMQKEIAKFGEYESFGGRRIILRQGHPPSASYFVLSGEMFELIYESSDGKPKLGQSIVKGDEFGDKAIIDDSTRECTVITKEPTELLSLKKKHFRRIFMLGGGLCVLDPEQKQFIRHLPYMNGFPIEKLEENSEKVKAQYFKKGDMITDDTRYFPWLILVKTGSVFIYKRLKKAIPLKSCTKEQANTSGEGHKRENPEKRELTRRQMLSDIRIPVRKSTELDPFVIETKAGKPGKFIHPGDRNQEDTFAEVSLSGDNKTKQLDTKHKYSFHRIQDQLLKRTTTPHFEPVKSPSSTHSNASFFTNTESSMIKNQSKEGSRIHPTEDDSDIKVHRNFWEQARSKVKEKVSDDTNCEIVCVNTISDGQIFGLDDIMINKRIDQRQSFSVFSSGADLIFIDKYFFRENMTERFRSNLVKYFCPYPSDEELQEQLQTQVNWNDYRMKTMDNTLFLLAKESKLRKSQKYF